ncbi:MAG: FlgD immunoglobulin-like domain containing protein, partial [Candidatus Kapaibacterium sp.]
RPYLGQRSFGDRTYVPIRIIPVELTVFEGQKRSSAVDLWWETASEKNNSGFHVERRVDGDQTWADLGFIGSKAGANGNSTTELNYNYTDKNVSVGSVYEYRLRQVDLDGSATYSQSLKFAFDGTNSTANIESLGPNPFVDGAKATTLNYSVSSASHVKVDIVDLMGNVVKTLVNADVTAGRYSVEWDGSNSNGSQVANGSYIYRFVAGDAPIETRVLKVIR